MKVDMHRGSGHDSVNDARVAMALAINWVCYFIHICVFKQSIT